MNAIREALRKIDADTIRFIQECYLFLWDRTGIYAATVEIGIFSVYFALELQRSGMNFILFVGTLFALLVAGNSFYHQSQGNYKMFNIVSRLWRQSMFRILATFFWVGCLITDFLFQRPFYFVATDGALLLWVYIMCIQIRKRTPPEKLVEARQGVV
jgi:hypothetical protein